jgi:hypothetical protein
VAAPAARLARAGPASAALAALSVAAVLLPMLAVAAGPIATDDVWFHLAAGRAYASEGPWPARDPLLHTALPSAPVQHEWLFGVAVYALERAAGLHGLRALHGLAVLGIALAAGALFRRAAPTPPWAWLATGIFVVLAWWRLAQLRPDLASLGATLAACALLFAAPGVPSWRRVAAFAALSALWANLHSVFAVGLLLGVAVLLGIAFEAILARALGVSEGASGRGARARRIAEALGLGALAALANPRGVAQHLTFLHSSRESAIWNIGDEWIPFQPLSWRAGGWAESPLAWALHDALALAFLCAAGVGLLRLARARSGAALRAFDAEGFGLGLAALVAMFVSIRFRWLAFLPLVYLLRAARRPPALRAPASGWVAAGGALALALAFPPLGGLPRWTRLLPREPAAWLARTHVAGKYHAEGVRFLAEAGIEGNLFNHYWMGGFLGFWLAPRLRTFVDGRTEHYAPDVLADATTISGRLTRHGETFLEVLDRRGVDVFFGLGLAPMGTGPWLGIYTADHLRDAPGWVLAFRAVDQAVYLRRGDDEELARVADFYARAGVPFDPEQGFDPDRVIREAPGFARAWRLIPRDHAAREAAAARGGPEGVAAGETLALGYCAAGALESALEMSGRVLARDGLSRPARLCRVYALLRSGRLEEGWEEARALRRLAPSDPRLELAASIAATLAQRSQRAGGGTSVLLRYPLLDEAETAALLAGFSSASLARRDASGTIAASGLE